MAPKSRSILFFVLLSIMAISSLNQSSALGGGGGRGTIVGGWRPINDLKDPEVAKIAQFAVTEHNKQEKTALEFVAVVKGETQVVAGTNYRLVISAKDAAVRKSYRAVVWSKPWQKFLQLVSFDEV